MLRLSGAFLTICSTHLTVFPKSLPALFLSHLLLLLFLFSARACRLDYFPKCLYSHAFILHREYYVP